MAAAAEVNGHTHLLKKKLKTNKQHITKLQRKEVETQKIQKFTKIALFLHIFFSLMGTGVQNLNFA